LDAVYRNTKVYQRTVQYPSNAGNAIFGLFGIPILIPQYWHPISIPSTLNSYSLISVWDGRRLMVAEKLHKAARRKNCTQRANTT